jgi:hypothetical protein
MPAVQQHGFVWQDDLSRNVYGATATELASIGYTAEMDLPASFNKKGNTNVSFKVSNTPNTVCMGDALRNFSSVEPGKVLHLNVLQYEQTGTVKKMKSIVEVNITDLRAALFGQLTKEDIVSLDSLVKSVPKGRKPTPEEHKKMYDLQKELQTKSAAIYLNIKVDSKSQRRLQCSFNHFQAFLEAHPDRVIAKSTTDEFRGGKVLMEIASAPRSFKKAQAPVECD